ncbi:MAG: plastocyanin/azurin family copper-binding protein [Bacteroidota bacterium]|nr:plastocyanin/azurin family copper-binding protein [Bacteroidota bacterium]
MKKIINNKVTIFLLLIINQLVTAQDKATISKESEYYKIVNIPLPEGMVLEVGGLCALPDGRIAIVTRRGEVFMMTNANMENDNPPIITKYAEGLNEALGVAYKEGSIYVAQRGELTKISDYNNDGKADAYEQVSKWPLSGNYHEFTFGPKIDKDGNFIVTMNVGFHPQRWWVATSYAPYRGFMVKITPDGKIEPIANGLRSPAALYVMPTGEYFYAENQGDWVGSGGITHVEKGDFVGNPASLAWVNLPGNPVNLKYEDFIKATGMKADFQQVDDVNATGDYGIPMFEMAKKVPQIKTQAVVLPHSVMGQSTSDFYMNDINIRFAPYFDGSIFVGDQAQSKIMRITLEKVKGVFQGAAFPFREGFSSGVMRFAHAQNGDLYVGMTSRGWGSTGRDWWGLQKLVWTGKIPFEMKNIKATPDGFEIEFLKPVDKATASNTMNYKVTSFTYKYHHFYGSPIIKDTICKIKGVKLSEDGKKARIVVDKIKEGYVHEIKVSNIVSAEKEEMLHNVGYYTLKRIPDGDKLTITAEMTAMSHRMEMKTVTSTNKTQQQKAAIKPAKEVTMGKNVTKIPASWNNTQDKIITLGTKPGLMYDQSKIIIKAGSKIKLVFNNSDDMLHNVVITKPGKADAIGETATNMGLEGPKMNYVPLSDDVLFHTKLVTPGSSESIYFVAPKTPGTYTIVCTYPGHYASMQCQLVVQ